MAVLFQDQLAAEANLVYTSDKCTDNNNKNSFSDGFFGQKPCCIYGE